MDAEQWNKYESCGGVGRNTNFNIPPKLPILGRLHLRFRRKDYRREMFENKQKKMISRILSNHGFKNQLIKTVEELSELTTAIVQYYNKGPGESRLRGVQEEIADVYIMLEQIRRQFMSDCELKELIEYKLDRECSRIEGRYHE